jgi:LPXTG-motif cell wall-anchored protein
MKQHAPVRFTIAASLVAAVGFMTATPAAAAEEPAPPAIGEINLPVPDGGITAGGFGTKGCTGIPGGAKVGTDGWVFSQPVADATEVAYIFGLLPSRTPDTEPVVLGINADGITGLKFDDAPNPSSGLKDLTKDTSDEAKALIAKAAEGDDSSADDSADGVTEIPVPAGVSGGLIANNGGAWLQTPAGWILAAGVLVHDKGKTNIEKFDLLRVCAPASPPTNAPGAGGGTGESLPVTGDNIGLLAGLGVLLLGLGAALLIVRRRRTTTFVA